MSDYAKAWDALCDAIGAADGKSAGYFDQQDHMTTDQRLKAAEVAALLSIAQELNKMNAALEQEKPLTRAQKLRRMAND